MCTSLNVTQLRQCERRTDSKSENLEKWVSVVGVESLLGHRGSTWWSVIQLYSNYVISATLYRNIKRTTGDLARRMYTHTHTHICFILSASFFFPPVSKDPVQKENKKTDNVTGKDFLLRTWEVCATSNYVNYQEYFCVKHRSKISIQFGAQKVLFSLFKFPIKKRYKNALTCNQQ